jgi:hypothetical protein
MHLLKIYIYLKKQKILYINFRTILELMGLNKNQFITVQSAILQHHLQTSFTI